MMISKDSIWMRRALKLAKHAAELNEVPIGAVLVRNNELLSEAWNQPINDHDPTAHAEILVLRKAGLSQQNYRLPNTTLYVTLEPCLMCYGAMINARVGRVVYGASDRRFGVTQQLDSLNFNHKIKITAGVLEDDCASILSMFFESKRKVKVTQADIAE